MLVPMPRWLKGIICLLLLVVVAAVVGAGSQLRVLFSTLEPPTLPPARLTETVAWDSGQHWPDATRQAFHYKSQGSRTLNIPLSWFLALEQPSDGVLSLLFGREKKFSDNAYLSRLGFVPQPASAENPDGLPIGFAVTPYQNLIGIDRAEAAIGFTCAACHTGQLQHEGKRYLIDGGAAMVDLGLLTVAIESALGQTELAATLPLFNGKFDRFSQRVLGRGYSEMAVANLKKDMKSVIAALSSQPNGIDVVEGFSRLDALNRIGNQVFALDPGRDQNYVNIRSPVNFPPIWTSSWFSWVQYDGSIMQPLIRNAGEAMGTAAATNFTAPVGEGRFSNAIPMDHLHWIESSLAGPDQPSEVKSFNGLRAPVWPQAFGEIDYELVTQGEALYEQHCQSCHLPALTRAVETGQAPDHPFWDHFARIQWTDKQGEPQSSVEALLDLNIVHQDYVGTDPGQSNVLAMRTVDTASNQPKNIEGMGIDVDVCVLATPLDNSAQGSLTIREVTDSPMLPYPYALGAVVELAIDEWLASRGDSLADRQYLQGDRPNCLQAGQGYKARPLNGLWSTAPFLHNGSVPTLRHLLGNPDNRPTTFLLGDPAFDPVDVGIEVVQPDVSETGNYTSTGYFILRTEIPGNSNRGHEFRDEQGAGRIGPALEDHEVSALIEFLKSM